MNKYRKKPVVIEAVQYFDWMRKEDKLPEGVHIIYWSPDGVNGISSDHPTIKTLEGMHLVSDGDWVITGLQGEKYPCKPDVFAMTYDEVES